MRSASLDSDSWQPDGPAAPHQGLSSPCGTAPRTLRIAGGGAGGPRRRASWPRLRRGRCCVSDPAAVERVVHQTASWCARAGFRYRNSTISPDLPVVTDAFRAKGADGSAPVTGPSWGPRTALLFMTAAGARCTTSFAGDDGHGQQGHLLRGAGHAQVKLIGNTLISFMLEGLCEGIVLGRKAGSPSRPSSRCDGPGYQSPYYMLKGTAIASRTSTSTSPSTRWSRTADAGRCRQAADSHAGSGCHPRSSRPPGPTASARDTRGGQGPGGWRRPRITRAERTSRPTSWQVSARGGRMDGVLSPWARGRVAWQARRCCSSCGGPVSAPALESLVQALTDPGRSFVS